jgi:hypothetical protein
MPTRRTEPTHEGDLAPRDASAAPVESPSADRMQGSNGPLHQPDPDDTNPAGDQDIDTAGTDADDQSPTKAMGTGIAPPRTRG